MIEVSCPLCRVDSEIEWRYDCEVTCPNCSATLALDWDEDDEDNVEGPWVTFAEAEGRS